MKRFTLYLPGNISIPLTQLVFIWTSILIDHLKYKEDIIFLMKALISLFNQTEVNRKQMYIQQTQHWETQCWYGFAMETFIVEKTEQPSDDCIIELFTPLGSVYCQSLLLVNCQFSRQVKKTQFLDAFFKMNPQRSGPLSWNCRIYRLRLCRGVRLPQRVIWI